MWQCCSHLPLIGSQPVRMSCPRLSLFAFGIFFWWAVLVPRPLMSMPVKKGAEVYSSSCLLDLPSAIRSFSSARLLWTCSLTISPAKPIVCGRYSLDLPPTYLQDILLLLTLPVLLLGTFAFGLRTMHSPTMMVNLPETWHSWCFSFGIFSCGLWLTHFGLALLLPSHHSSPDGLPYESFCSCSCLLVLPYWGQGACNSSSCIWSLLFLMPSCSLCSFFFFQFASEDVKLPGFSALGASQVLSSGNCLCWPCIWVSLPLTSSLEWVAI